MDFRVWKEPQPNNRYRGLKFERASWMSLRPNSADTAGTLYIANRTTAVAHPIYWHLHVVRLPFRQRRQRRDASHRSEAGRC